MNDTFKGIFPRLNELQVEPSGYEQDRINRIREINTPKATYKYLDTLRDMVHHWIGDNFGMQPDFIMVHPLLYRVLRQEIYFAGYCGSYAEQLRYRGILVVECRNLQEDQIEIVTKSKR